VVLLVLLFDRPEWRGVTVGAGGCAGAVVWIAGRIQAGFPGSKAAPMGPSLRAWAAADCSSQGLYARSCASTAHHSICAAKSDCLTGVHAAVVCS
jgi:hypothetical protein